ncbi:MAG TPA: bifunctional nicotinamidase/pyrazinamidase [Rhodobacteraceae bacterium]|jgi:nicotinamidase/pyrazinamidase|nr:bifunctional nicotinamidase/pyrazinamidase [Pseudomonadota bacterium]MDA1287604.1 bifunctional nicotinamidase/pyrazinamidase [Pseudomonadota bacterium]NQW13908.1 bifunctional nicotinamidase/pyrazinamidase [Rhodobacter sp.]HBN31358.1 bifunctional nicotinamidase/pyrazinamidase [Paracoccaceae bacterium]
MAEKIKLGKTDVLVVIDVQKDFCAGGALAVQNADAIVSPINSLMTQFDNVVISQDWHPVGHKSFYTSHKGKMPFETTMMPYGEQILWPAHCVAGTPGAEFHSDLDTSQAKAIIRKGTNVEIDSYSTFFENDRKTPTGMAGYLRQNGFTRIFLTGIATEYCVGFSAIDGIEEGFDVFVITDATASFDNEDYEHMQKRWDECGVKKITMDALRV